MVVGAAALALVAAGCGGSGSSGSSTGGTKQKGGTATYALPPSSTPNYIWPYSSSAVFSVTNASYLQDLLYRPLYWFGKGTAPDYNASLSLANAPQFSGNKVTITLKHYMWSNGQPVTASNVMFWLNMETAEPANYGGYTGFPASIVKDIKVVSPTQLTMTMDKAYSHNWFLYNELAQIYPMPEAWDRTASGPKHCTTTVSDCKAVYSYLDSQSKTLNSYASSPLWSVVDGPWKLSSFNADGHITFVPNKSYSGPVKPTLSQFKEVPFTTDSAEYSVLQAPNSSIDVGYLPEQDAPAKPLNATVGRNPLNGYTLDPLYAWGINYYVMNFQSTTGNGPIIKQLYFRQALAYLMNQKSVIQGPLRGYGQFTIGPIPSAPKTQFLSPSASTGDPFPFSESKAKSLLTSHGWKVTPNGVTTCTNPSMCGPGIKKGQGLNFQLPFANGTAWITSEMTQLQSNAASVGIKLNLKPEPFNQVIALAGGNCVVTKSSCNWDFANWGGGWDYFPDFYPTGEELFMCGVPANSGGYCNKQNDSLINSTLTNSSMTPMYNWQNFISPQLPMQWQPNGAYELTEIKNNLRGVTPQPATLSINPENWYFVK
ncbi:MAG TPA: ABC transporter substrate-binding protein [Streptosporangiaceae bacterium]